MRSLPKATGVIADLIFSTVVAPPFLVVTLMVKDVLVAQKKNVVVTKVGMVNAMGMTKSNGGWNKYKSNTSFFSYFSGNFKLFISLNYMIT